MPRAPRSAPDTSPAAQYERLLADSLALQTKFEEQMAEVDRLADAGDRDGAVRAQERMPHYGRDFDRLLRQRVELLRVAEHLKTMEDAFPRVKSPSAATRREVDATALIDAFNAGKASLSDLRAAGRQIGGADEAQPLDDAEFRAFLKARRALAKELGYKVESTLMSRSFDFSRNGVSFTLDHYPIPSGFGITGHGRISKIGASTGPDSDPWPPNQLWYDGGYDVVSTDPAVQREIDRAVAIFG